MNNLHFMLDLETMATTPHAAITAIGVVRFDPYAGDLLDEFYTNITLKSNRDAGRVIAPETVEWWLQQDKAAQDALFKEPRLSLQQALRNFNLWLWKFGLNDPNTRKRAKLWSNGPTFDEVILRDAYDDITDLKLPISFSGSRCVRTAIEVARAMGLAKPLRKGQHHNALDDARYQAEGVIAVFQELDLEPRRL